MNKSKRVLIGVFIAIIVLILSGIISYEKINSQKLSKENSKSDSVINATNETNIIESEDNAIIVEMDPKYEEDDEVNEINSEYDYSTLENEETTSELFNAYYGKAMGILKNMSLNEKVGQLFLVRYPEADMSKQVSEEFPGGYILFGKDFKYENPTSIANKIAENQNNSKTKLLIGVDEEGGEVVRISCYPQYRDSGFLSPQELDKEGGLERIIQDSHEKTKLLKSLGINFNLSPVADVSTNENSFIYNRTYGKSADETSMYIKEVIRAMNKDGIVSALKHFPGYGDNEDTHTGIVVDEREITEFEEKDLKPFASGIEEKSPTILVSHSIVKSMDEKLPASLSPNVHRILKEDLNFSGLTITDDLEMGAVKEYVENGNAAVQAIVAGNDMIITSSFKAQKNEVLNAIREGIISEDTINRSVRKILACKLAYGIIV